MANNPPSLYVLDYSSNVEVRILLPSQLLDPTPVGQPLGTGGPALATAETQASPPITDRVNRIIRFRGELYAMMGDTSVGSTTQGIYAQNQGGVDQWGQVLPLQFVGDGRGSGLHILHPGGVPTLCLLMWNQVGSDLFAYWSTDGRTWQSDLFLTSAPQSFGSSLAWRNAIYIPTHGGFVWTYDFDLEAFDSYPNAPWNGNLRGTAVGLHVHENTLFSCGFVSGAPDYFAVAKLVAGNWITVYNDSVRSPNGQDRGTTGNYGHCCMFTDPASGDLIVFASGVLETTATPRTEIYRIQNAAGSPTVTIISDVVLGSVEGADKYLQGGAAASQDRAWYVYVDNDTVPTSPRVFLYTRFDRFGPTEMWEWTGYGDGVTPGNSEIELVGGGAGLATNQFGLPESLFGGGERSVISASIEIGDAANQDFEVVGGRRFYWRAFGSGGPFTGTFYVDSGEGAADTVAPIAAGSLVVEGTDLLTDLEVYYKFDNNGQDSSGNGLDLTLTGSVPFVSGGAEHLGTHAADFQGGADGNYWARGVDDAVLDIGVGFAPYAISLWADLDGFDTPYGSYLLSKAAGGAGLAFPDGWVLWTIADGRIVLGVGGSPLTDFATPTGVITTGAGWQHIVVTSDGTTLKIYVDGVERLSQAAVNHVNSTQPLRIGQSGPNNAWVDGRIDDVGIWSRHLTHGEVQRLYNAGTGRTIDDQTAPTTPSISGNTITNITPDDGAVLYSVVFDLSSISIGSGAPGRLMGDLT